MLRHSFCSKRSRPHTREAGQTAIFFLLVLATFLLGAMALAFDFSHMWFRRQALQSAADAACTAGAMDLLVDAEGGATGHQGFTPGTPYTCTTASTDSICSYAAKNGYNSDGASPGNLVNVTFPAAVSGVTPPPAAEAAVPFIRVDITDNVQTFFWGLLNGATTAPVAGHATCGVVNATSPIPIVVLDPQNPNVKPKSSALDVQGSPTITIVGGPTKSIQVNSSDVAATNIGGSGTIDLSKGGPNGTGSDIGIYGGPAIAPGGFIPGSTGHWISPAAPINDPFAQLATPTQPAAAPVPVKFTPSAANVVTGGILCPDTSCTRYSPGYYPSGICIGSSCGAAPCNGSGGNCVAIFDPGVYYINGDFKAKSNSCLRPSGAPDLAAFSGIAEGGVIFYFTGGGAVNVDANSGAGSKCNADFVRDGYAGTTTLQYGVKCTATSQIIPPNLIPPTLSGNVMLGPCLGTYGDPLGAADPMGVQRGILMFQDRSTLSANQSWGGGGSFILAGTMYFHSCNGGGTGQGCGAAGTYFNDMFTLQGNPGSTTYVLGDIIADNIVLGGNSAITMDLNPTKAFTILKVTLLQ